MKTIFSKSLRFVCAALSLAMMLSCASFSVSAVNTEPLVIPYTGIQRGNVDGKKKATVETVSDPEKGTVVKISPVVDTTESGAVMIDGFYLTKYGIDLNYYKYITVEYKYVSEYPESLRPFVNYMRNGNVLSAAVGVESNEDVCEGEWATAVFDMSEALQGKVTGTGILEQLHFYPFGQGRSPRSMEASDYMLVGNFTFSGVNPEGSRLYNVTFEAGNIPGRTGSLPEDYKAHAGDVLTLPEPGVSAEGRVAVGWTVSGSSRVYRSGEQIVMPGSDLSLRVSWGDALVSPDVKILRFPDYFLCICDNKNTAVASKTTYEGVPVVEVVPNIYSSVNTGINLDGWVYGSANIDVTQYKSLILSYKYISSSPKTGHPQINVMKGESFTGGTEMASADPIRANRWTAASFDLTPCAGKTIAAQAPTLRQLHVYPLGGNKPSTMRADDIIYVDRLIAVTDKVQSADVRSGYIGGYEDGTFRPNGTMTRAEACAALAKADAGGEASVPENGTSNFSDVSSGAWYAKYIAYCEGNGFIAPCGGNFLPDSPITRSEFSEIIYRRSLPASERTALNLSCNTPFSGQSGNGSRLAGGNLITRAEAVRMINAAFNIEGAPDVDMETVAGKLYKDVDTSHWAYADIAAASASYVVYLDENGVEHLIFDGGSTLSEEAAEVDFAAGLAKKNEVDALIAERAAEIRASVGDYSDITGTKIYVSPSGSDANDGRSPATAVATIERGNSLVKSGDALLLERGGEWRTTFTSKAGVTYGAYGEGAKPLINGNLIGNVGGASNWTLVPGTSNIWKLTRPVNDIGNIILNRTSTFEKIVPSVGGSVLLVGGRSFDPATSFTKNRTFFVVYGSVNGNSTDYTSLNSTLYVRCDEGNPGSLYSDIELATRNTAIVGSGSGCVFDNIAVMFAGCHGIGGIGGSKNVRFQNCEIGWIGGSAQYFQNGSMVRFGNGVEVYGSCNGYYIDNCYIYQCYDAGVTHQYSRGGTNDVLDQNVEYTNNVIEKCIYNIEYFMGAADSSAALRYMKNILIKDNILAYSGAGWGMAPDRSAQIKGWQHYNRAENFVIEGNIFLMAEYYTLDMGASREEWMPGFRNNTYILPYGHKFMKFASWTNNYGDGAEDFVRNKMQENGYHLYFLEG